MPDPVIAPVVDDWFLEHREDRESDGMFHPSSLAGCLRQAMYEATGTERTDLRAVRSDRIMLLGSYVHERIQEALAALPGFRAEVGIDVPGLGLRGSADGIWRIDSDDPMGPRPGDWELIELKTEGVFKRKRRQKGSSVNPENEKQARLYMMAMNMMGINVVRARVVYLLRDDLDIDEHVLDRDTDLEQRYTDELQSMLMLKANGMLPPRLEESSPMRWLCDYCSWKTRCWGLDVANRRYDG